MKKEFLFSNCCLPRPNDPAVLFLALGAMGGLSVPAIRATEVRKGIDG